MSYHYLHRIDGANEHITADNGQVRPQWGGLKGMP